MNSSKIYLAIFSQKITPINTYILVGDKKPELEIKSIYLDKVISDRGNKVEKEIIINNKSEHQLNSDQTTAKGKTGKEEVTEPLKNGKKRTINHSEEEIFLDNDSILNKSIDKVSISYLSSLLEQGEFSDKHINLIELSNEQKNKFKLQSNNPFIISLNKLHPFSIFYGTKYDKLINKNNELALPAPYYIEKKKWCLPEDNSLQTVLDGVKIDDELGFVLDSPFLKKKFSGLILDIIGQIIRVPFGHKISLNIRIFEPNTVLSRYTKLFSFANTYLLKACNPKLIPYERFKFIIAFLFAGLYIVCKQLKPFNPFLGETFEGEFPNGAKIYVENVTHTPLVARFLLRYKKKYEVNGYWDLRVLTASLGNEIIIHQKGPINIIFPELNESYVGHIPFVKAVNTRSEVKRALKFFGSLVLTDPKHNYKAFIEFDHNKNVFHEIKGCTMHYEFPKGYKYDVNKEWDFGLKFKMENDMEINHKKTKMNDKYTIYEPITGSFIQHLKIGNDIIWDIEKILPDKIKPVKYCLPSDGRYREDLIWLYRSYYNNKDEKEEEIYREIGMKWKVMMEEFNRWERKHRAEYKEQMKKRK